MVGIIARVVRRYAAATVDVSAILKTFQQQRAAIEKALEADNVEEARRLFVALGESLQPLARALEGVVIQRSDEQRKLKNVKQWLHRIRYPFKAEYLNEPDAEVVAWIWGALDTIDEALKSIGRVSDRIQGYQTIEKDFQHGPFKIVNKYGFRPEEYDEPLKLLDAATAKLESAGFGNLAYGTVFLEKANTYAGIYHKSNDSIGLNVEARNRFSSLYTVIHEFGHRYWYERLSSAQRETYEDIYAHGRVLTVEQRQDMWQALKGADFQPAKAVRLLRDPSLVERFQLYWKERVKPTGWSSKVLTEHPEFIENNFLAARVKYVYLDMPIVTVSDYAKSSFTEDFAENFAHHVLKMKIPEPVMERFGPTV
jgi:hypothetical protein